MKLVKIIRGYAAAVAEGESVPEGWTAVCRPEDAPQGAQAISEAELALLAAPPLGELKNQLAERARRRAAEKLAATDYAIIRQWEQGTLPQDELDALKAQRQAVRDACNALEAALEACADARSALELDPEL
ncbi:MAG: hypothetical protein GX410_01105 [Elusimicrobia bacterium]|nr:hypothetical protein [Elusimicrobiota bacterium]